MVSNDLFPIFCYAIQSNTTISAFVDDKILPGIPLSEITPYLDTGNFTCISITTTTESVSIQDQGYKLEYRIKLDFTYDINVASKKGDSESYARTVADAIISFIRSDLNVIYDNRLYNLYIESIGTNPDFNIETEFWVIPLRCKGYAWTKFR